MTDDRLPCFRFALNAGDQLVQALAPLLGNLLQAIPERFFQADTGIAASNENRMSSDRSHDWPSCRKDMARNKH